MDFFELMWIVGISDFVLKYITVSLKCLILALPRIVIAVKSKVNADPNVLCTRLVLLYFINWLYVKFVRASGYQSVNVDECLVIIF